MFNPIIWIKIKITKIKYMFVYKYTCLFVCLFVKTMALIVNNNK